MFITALPPEENVWQNILLNALVADLQQLLSELSI